MSYLPPPPGGFGMPQPGGHPYPVYPGGGMPMPTPVGQFGGPPAAGFPVPAAVPPFTGYGGPPVPMVPQPGPPQLFPQQSPSFQGPNTQPNFNYEGYTFPVPGAVPPFPGYGGPLVAMVLQQSLSFQICKYDIEESIKREMSGDLKDAMVSVVRVVRNAPAFFAEKLYKSMKGLGTDDDMLIRVIVTRSEIDLLDIRDEFAKQYGTPLGQFIADDTRGNYKKILLQLIGEQC